MGVRGLGYGGLVEIPEDAVLALSRENAAWLHRYADEHFAGDVPRALNEVLDYLRAALEPPADLWAPIVELERRSQQAQQL